jgi:hypothetical protein
MARDAAARPARRRFPLAGTRGLKVVRVDRTPVNATRPRSIERHRVLARRRRTRSWRSSAGPATGRCRGHSSAAAVTERPPARSTRSVGRTTGPRRRPGDPSPQEARRREYKRELAEARAALERNLRACAGNVGPGDDARRASRTCRERRSGVLESRSGGTVTETKDSAHEGASSKLPNPASPQVVGPRTTWPSSSPSTANGASLRVRASRPTSRSGRG